MISFRPEMKCHVNAALQDTISSRFKPLIFGTEYQLNMILKIHGHLKQ